MIIYDLCFSIYLDNGFMIVHRINKRRIQKGPSRTSSALAVRHLIPPGRLHPTSSSSSILLITIGHKVNHKRHLTGEDWGRGSAGSDSVQKGSAELFNGCGSVKRNPPNSIEM